MVLICLLCLLSDLYGDDHAPLHFDLSLGRSFEREVLGTEHKHLSAIAPEQAGTPTHATAPATSAAVSDSTAATRAAASISTNVSAVSASDPEVGCVGSAGSAASAPDPEVGCVGSAGSAFCVSETSGAHTSATVSEAIPVSASAAHENVPAVAASSE